MFYLVSVLKTLEKKVKNIYENPEYKKTNERQATHPHQIHLELLSEIGLIGYILFLSLMLFSIIFLLKII